MFGCVWGGVCFFFLFVCLFAAFAAAFAAAFFSCFFAVFSAFFTVFYCCFLRCFLLFSAVFFAVSHYFRTIFALFFAPSGASELSVWAPGSPFNRVYGSSDGSQFTRNVERTEPLAAFVDSVFMTVPLAYVGLFLSVFLVKLRFFRCTFGKFEGF
jgi:hypothetical protein